MRRTWRRKGGEEEQEGENEKEWRKKEGTV